MSTEQIVIAQFLFPSNFPTELETYPESTGKRLLVHGDVNQAFNPNDCPVPIYDRGLYFNGENQMLYIDSSSDEDVYSGGPFLSHSYTIQFVFRPLETIVFKHHFFNQDQDNDEKIHLYINNYSLVGQFATASDGYTYQIVADAFNSDSAIYLQWHQMALSVKYDASISIGYFHLDGVQIHSGQFSAWHGNTENLQIETRVNKRDQTKNKYKGFIWSIEFYNYAIDADVTGSPTFLAAFNAIDLPICTYNQYIDGNGS